MTLPEAAPGSPGGPPAGYRTGPGWTGGPDSGLWSDQPWLIGIALLGAALRLAITGLMLHGGLPVLAVANGLGAACYASVALLARRGRWLPGLAAGMACEVVLQATLAVLWLGGDCGFGYHILLLLPVLLFTAWPPRTLKWVAAIGVAGLYMALDLSSRLRPAPVLLAEPLQLGLHALNAATALLILGLIAARHQRRIGHVARLSENRDGAQALSRMLNRRRIAELADSHLQRIGDPSCERPDLCLMLGDIDQLGQIVDRLGQDAADRAQGAVGAALLQGMRQGDLVGRWGADGFLIVLPGTDAGTGRMVGERLLALVRALEIRADDGALLSPSISLGLCPVAAGEKLDEAIARADEALRLTRQGGRSHIGLAASGGR